MNTRDTDSLSQSTDIMQTDSMRITSLRFFLIILVIFIHNNLKAEDINNYNVIFDEPTIITFIKFFICNILGAAAVPLFFLFSGYLQFSKEISYKLLLKKKIKSLFVPYFLWTFINVLLYFIGETIPFFSGYFQNENNIIRKFTLIDWIQLFWAHEDGFPFVYQFWFLRNLIVLVIISPILRFLANKIPITFGVIIVVCFINGLPFELGSSLFYYMSGYYFCKYKISFFDFADRITWYEYAFLMISSIIIQKLFPATVQLCGLGTIITSLFFLKLSGIFIQNSKVFEKLKYLSGYSFFLYAIHTPFLGTTLNKISIKTIPLQGIFCLVQFVIPCILVIVIGTEIGILLKKICSPLFRVLNGGR